MKDFAMQLTQKCVSMGLLDESYSEWFAYSIEKRVTTLFTWLVQCLIGGFCFGWTLTISFSVFFLLIRKYTNGYHAATYSKCLFCSILLEVVLLASISYVFRTGLALLFLTIVSDITILYIAPVNNKSIHWSTNEFIAAITFHEVDGTPHTQTGTQSDHQSLQNVHCTIEKFHISSPLFGKK